MSQTPEYIAELVYKFNKGDISTEELQLLTAWYNSHDDEQVVVPSEMAESNDEVKARMLSGLLSKVSQQPDKRTSTSPLFRWVAGTAAILVLSLSTWYLLQDQKIIQKPQVAQTSIEPGGNKATLTLADGRTIALSSRQGGIVAGEKITYTNGTPVADAVATADDQILSLHTPKGGTYSITLPDGSQVWLNAATTIKYPAHFAADARIIQLEGEAFFHVKPAFRKNGEKVPFRVITDHQEVEVLGTQFNVNSYREQAATKTTLVEGKVSVNDKNNYKILTPNQQAVTIAGNTKVRKVNAYNYTSWRDGKFSFDGKTFEETMNEIARWYDLDVVYENGIPKEELSGDAYRNQNIRSLFRILKVAQINYQLDVSKRKLIIK